MNITKLIKFSFLTFVFSLILANQLLFAQRDVTDRQDTKNNLIAPIPLLLTNGHDNYRNNNYFHNFNYKSLGTLNSSQPNWTIFDNIGQNFLNSFKGRNLYLQLAGVASTILIVSTNTDYHVQKYFNEHEGYSDAARPVVYSGMLLPFIASGSLYAYAKLKKDNEVLGASFAVMQASILQLIYNSTLKAITGRPNPDWQHTSDMKSLSKIFRFGFLRGGVFWGWPSGHTSATTAVVSALIGYYPNSTWLKVAGFGLIAYTIFGVSAFHRGGMHWFSDAIAAAFISYAVGSTVGKYYRERLSSANSLGENITPEISSNFPGFSFSIQF